MFDSRKHRELLPGCEELGPRRCQQVVAAADEHLVLFPAQAQPRVQLAELRVDVGQQRFVMVVAYGHHVVERIETRLPADELLAQVRQVEVVLQARLSPAVHAAV